MMTKKHFKIIAKILAEYRYFDRIDDIVTDFSKWLKTENPNFDDIRFRNAVIDKENIQLSNYLK
jgi:hypothetical protein